MHVCLSLALEAKCGPQSTSCCPNCTLWAAPAETQQPRGLQSSTLLLDYTHRLSLKLSMHEKEVIARAAPATHALQLVLSRI
eukprot:3920997-Amphidinium_carterae.1